MNLLEEIRHGFANLRDGAMLSIGSLSTVHEGWIFREDGHFGVAIEIPGGPLISEHFAGARLASAEREFNGTVHTLLRLDSDCEALRNEFAVVCAQFLDPGENGDARKALVTDPLSWWSNWRELLGNAVRERNAYSALGELLALERLRSKGVRAEWRGPLRGSVDIETPEEFYEVKSTLSRYNSVIHIAGQFQLNLMPDRRLFIVHQRFEPASHGDSVDAVVRRLVNGGANSIELEALLARCGLEAGCAARMEKYRILESKIYAVDENFPRISPASFIGGVVPPGIVAIAYDVDLAGLDSHEF